MEMLSRHETDDVKDVIKEMRAQVTGTKAESQNLSCGRGLKPCAG